MSKTRDEQRSKLLSEIESKSKMIGILSNQIADA